MNNDILRFRLDSDQRVLDKKLSKDTHRIFKRKIDQILLECAYFDQNYILTNKIY